MTGSAGYSGKSLAAKLGIKPGYRIKTHNAPPNYLELLGPVPDGVSVSSGLRAPVSMCHTFVTARSELERDLARYPGEIRQDGTIWVSWPKKSSGVAGDVTEDVVREVALPLGLVDVKVCAVDEVWSGLKLVIRRENRRS